MIKRLILYFISLVICVSFISVLISLAKWPFIISSKVRKEIQDRTVKIEVFNDCEGGQGTGTKMGHGYVLTNAHLFPEHDYCVKPEIKIPFLEINQPEIITPGGSIHAVYKNYTDENFKDIILISSDTKKDIAILRFGGEDNTPEIKFTTHWHMQEPILLIGNPSDGDFIEGKTRLIAFTILPNPMHYVRSLLVFACDTGGPGFSGSGIYNTDGEFLGIFELGSTSFDLCYAIPTAEILKEGIDKPWLKEK